MIQKPSFKGICCILATLIKIVLGIKGFHDCVGGCDGCLNLDNPNNAGLGPIIEALEELYTGNGYFAWGVSRADFWALAATVSVERGVQLANEQPTSSGCGCEDE
jgi:hypothetical protein